MSIMSDDEFKAYLAEEREFKEGVFYAVCSFIMHEKDCVSCAGEVELSVCDREKYLCDVGRGILAWWFSRPEFVIKSLMFKCPKCGFETET